MVTKNELLAKVENRDKFIGQQQKELDKYKIFAMVVENLVNGKREPKEIIDRIKKRIVISVKITIHIYTN